MAELTAERLLMAYARGVFPMAQSAADPQLYWFDPPERGILPVGGVHASRSMRRVLRNCGWRASIDQDFAGVIAGCADREETWINGSLTELYIQLFSRGHAHSLEIHEGDELVGGIYGVTLGSAFFAESMFSRRPNASKAALIWMSSHLRRTGFQLWDTQYPTPHLTSMGGIAVSRAEYHQRLGIAIRRGANFRGAALPDPHALWQEITQTS